MSNPLSASTPEARTATLSKDPGAWSSVGGSGGHPVVVGSARHTWPAAWAYGIPGTTNRLVRSINGMRITFSSFFNTYYPFFLRGYRHPFNIRVFDMRIILDSYETLEIEADFPSILGIYDWQHRATSE
jgi:hypothetical protein